MDTLKHYEFNRPSGVWRAMVSCGTLRVYGPQGFRYYAKHQQVTGKPWRWGSRMLDARQVEKYIATHYDR